MRRVTGSSPVSSTKKHDRQKAVVFFDVGWTSQTAAQRSGCGLERRSSGVSELSSPRGSELIRSLRRRYRPPKQKSRLQAALRKEVGLRWLLLTKNMKQACPQWPRLFYLLDSRVQDPMLVISVDNGASPPHPSRLTPCRLPLKGKAFLFVAVSQQTGVSPIASCFTASFQIHSAEVSSPSLDT